MSHTNGEDPGTGTTGTGASNIGARDISTRDIGNGVARRDAASALRDLVHAFVGHDVSIEQLEQVTSALSELTADLTTAPPRTRSTPSFTSTFAREFARQAAPDTTNEVESTTPDEAASVSPLPEGPIADTFSDRPISGTASPYGLDLDLHREGDEVVAWFTLRHAHEGAPGRSHGGFVAAVFDDVFGFVLGMLAQPAFTGELTVRYVRPTPLHRRLECRVRLDRREGRKLLMTGELCDTTTGEVVATSTTTFITVDPATFHPDGTANAPTTNATTRATNR